jgi:hypothetical protein
MPATHLAFGYHFEPGPLKMVRFKAPLGCRALREQALKGASTLANLNRAWCRFDCPGAAYAM